MESHGSEGKGVLRRDSSAVLDGATFNGATFLTIKTFFKIFFKWNNVELSVYFKRWAFNGDVGIKYVEA